MLADLRAEGTQLHRAAQGGLRLGDPAQLELGPAQAVHHVAIVWRGLGAGLNEVAGSARFWSCSNSR